VLLESEHYMSVAGVSLCKARTPFVDGSRAGSPPCALWGHLSADVGGEDAEVVNYDQSYGILKFCIQEVSIGLFKTHII
jgi:hypothetical protein